MPALPWQGRRQGDRTDHLGASTDHLLIKLGAPLIIFPASLQRSSDSSGHVGEAGVVLEEGQLGDADGTVTVLGHDDLCSSPVGTVAVI